jgi:hypothetical protein
MIPSASRSAYPFPEAELGGKAFWVPPVRQTGFLHQAAILNVGTITRERPCAKLALSTLSTSEADSTGLGSLRRLRNADVHNRPFQNT